MTVNIKPSLASGAVAAPSSKSEGHRALICAALSDGSTVTNVNLCDDIKATLGGLAALGANTRVNGDQIEIGGIDTAALPQAEICAFESGSTLRFLMPLCLLCGKKTTFTGAPRLFSRDLSVYEEIAKNQGIDFIRGSSSVTVCGKLKGGEYKVRGDISSQFVSGLLFALPLIGEDSFIEFTTPVLSKPYIDMTVDMLSRFSVSVTPLNNGYFIPGNQRYVGSDVTLEGDYSNAAFLDALNLLSGKVDVCGLKGDSVQGDKIYKEFFKRIKSGGIYGLSDCPDLAPVMFALAAEFSGAAFKGTNRLKIKESDRAVAMAKELKKFGAELVIGDDEVTVKDTKLHAPKETLCSHGDHRIVMALAVLCSRYGGEIEGAEAVSKSYPGFFNDIRKLGIEVEIK